MQLPQVHPNEELEAPFSSMPNILVENCLTLESLDAVKYISKK